MAQRVYDNEVKEIVDTVLDTQPFIETASLLVDEELVSSGHSAARLRQIELYLSAHFVTIRDPQFQQLRGEKQSVSFHLGDLGQGLKSTAYGQQVLLLDTSGILAQVGMATRASFEVL